MRSYTDTGSLPIVEFRDDPKNRIFFAAIRFAAVLFATSILTGIFLQEVLLPNWAPPARFNAAGIFGLIVAVITTAILHCRRIFGVRVYSDTITFERPLGQFEIATNQLLAVLGSRGIDLSGGEVFPWKHSVFLSRFGSVKISMLDEQKNEGLLRAVCDIAPDALGVSLSNKLTLNTHAYPDAAYEMRRWYFRAAWKSIGLGLAGLAAMGLAVGLFAAMAPKNNVNGGDLGQLAMYGIVAVVICIGIAFLGVCDLFSLNRLQKTLAANWQGDRWGVHRANP